MSLKTSLAKKIVERTMKGKSMAQFQSDGYYLEDLYRCIHPQIKSYEDTKKSVEKIFKEYKNKKKKLIPVLLAWSFEP